MEKRVLVAMSGGVDSTVTVALLIEQGYQVEGLTLYLFDEAEKMVKDAAASAKALGIPHKILDLRAEFKKRVIDPYVQGYQRGMTPNPCMSCNKGIKFGLLFEEMKKGGYDYLATGHYARILWDDATQCWHLLKGKALRKDQSYFLHHLSQAQLGSILFPLGDFLSKDDVRVAAGHKGLIEATKKDSDGICFLSEGEHNGFLTEKIGCSHGEMRTAEGDVLGTHGGYYHFTIGQKKGLPEQSPKDYAVLTIQPEQNLVIIGPESLLYEQTLWVDEVVLQQGVLLPMVADVKIFCWGYTLEALLTQDEEVVKVSFSEPVRAIAKGQYAVFFAGDQVLGGGRVVRSQ